MAKASYKDRARSNCSLTNVSCLVFRNRYFGTQSIAVKCGSDDDTYVFPQEVLMRNFQYFRTTLKKEDTSPDNNPSEGVHNVHLENITTVAFARVVRWTQTDPRNREDAANPAGDYSIDGLLDEMIAAHHLGLDSIKEFEAHTCCLLATILLKDRRKLSSRHINIVESHKDFGKSSLVMKVFARAGVRPFLQSTMLSQAAVFQRLVRPGHKDAVEWLAIIRHCRQLRADNNRYSNMIGKYVARALETASRGISGEVRFHDPLDDDEMKGRRMLGVDVVFSI